MGFDPHICDYRDTTTPAATRIINAPQTCRSQVGSPRLVWNVNLAASALAWAKHNAAQGYLEHSNAPGVGENIWMGDLRAVSPIPGW